MTVTIQEITAAALDRHCDGLAAILHACVLGGASVGFLTPFMIEEAAAFFQGLRPGLESGARRLMGAWEGGRLVGTVQLLLANPANGSHRAEVAKMLVHPDARQRGIGRALMTAAETLARREGRTLLLLDTGSVEGRALYRSVGFEIVGEVPEYARHTGGSLLTTTFMMKLLAPGTTAPEPPADVTVTAATPTHPEAVRLMDILSDMLGARYGSDGRAGFADWTPEGSVFALAWRDGRVVGCGAIRPLPDLPGTAEVKRMYAEPGSGAGGAVLRFLEKRARVLDYGTLVLETRWANTRAVAFYQRHGYAVRENYGPYGGHSRSACLEKVLA